MEYLKKPLTPRKFEAACDKHGQIKTVIRVGLDELIDADIEGLNDLAEDRICGEGVPTILENLSFRVVDCVPGGKRSSEWYSGAVYLEVTADATEALLELANEDEETEE